MSYSAQIIDKYFYDALLVPIQSYDVLMMNPKFNYLMNKKIYLGAYRGKYSMSDISDVIGFIKLVSSLKVILPKDSLKTRVDLLMEIGEFMLEQKNNKFILKTSMSYMSKSYDDLESDILPRRLVTLLGSRDLHSFTMDENNARTLKRQMLNPYSLY